MYMDAMNATREEAINVMSSTTKGQHCHQLKEPIADAYCVKQYDADGNLIYVDKYSDITISETSGYAEFTVTRIDRDLIERAIRTYIYKDGEVVLSDEVIHNDSESVSSIYIVTAVKSDTPYRNYNGRVKKLTRIVPSSPIPKYTEGYVNISFKKTDDGDIRWEQVNSMDNIDYNWDTFANFNVNLNVKY